MVDLCPAHLKINFLNTQLIKHSFPHCVKLLQWGSEIQKYQNWIFKRSGDGIVCCCRLNDSSIMCWVFRWCHESKCALTIAMAKAIIPTKLGLNHLKMVPFEILAIFIRISNGFWQNGYHMSKFQCFGCQISDPIWNLDYFQSNHFPIIQIPD